MEISLHLVKHIFRSAPQHDGTGSRGFALHEVGKILVTNFSDIKQPALSSHVGLLNFLRSVDNLGIRDPSDSDIVSFSDSAND